MKEKYFYSLKDSKMKINYPIFCIKGEKIENKFLSCLCLLCPISSRDQTGKREVYKYTESRIAHRDITLNLCHCVKSKGSGSFLQL